MLNVIGRWCRIQFSDSANDSALRDAMNVFLADAHQRGFKSEVDRIRRIVSLQSLDKAKLSSNSTATSRYSTVSTTPVSSSAVNTAHQSRNSLNFGQSLVFNNSSLSLNQQSKLLDGPSTFCRGLESPVLELDPKDIAKYLTTIERRSLSQLLVSDVLSKVAGHIKLGNIWTGDVDIRDLFHASNNNGSDKLEKITGIAERANRIHNWVILELGTANSTKACERLLIKFLNIAKVTSCLLLYSQRYRHVLMYAQN